MSATEVVLYEWTATLDEGVNATTGEPWRGHRVKYRRQGETAVITRALHEHFRRNGR